MKKIARIVPFCLSVFFVLLIAFPAWIYWRYQYLFYNKYDGDITPELTQWIERFWGSAPALLGYVVPVLLLLLIVSLICAKYSWKDMACHLFFTLSAGFFLIFLTQFFSVHSARNIYISLYQTFSYLLADPLAENWSGGEGLMLTVLLAPAAVGLYALVTALKKQKQ